jgi:hypothetical protein
VRSYLEFNWLNVLITMLQNQDTNLANLIMEKNLIENSTYQGNSGFYFLQVSIAAMTRPASLRPLYH